MKPGRKIYLEIFGYLACLLIGLFIGLVAWPAFFVFNSIAWGRNVQTADSRTGHRAELLKKHNLADLNIIVRLDGEKVYESPDLMSCHQTACGEVLVWDDTRQVVALEILGKRSLHTMQKMIGN